MSEIIRQLDKEFLFTDEDFTFLSETARRIAGINLSADKRELVYGRVAKRLRLLGLRSFREYCGRLEGDGREELPHFINAITTNVTSFFRENHHFEYLADTVIPEVIAKNRGAARPRLRAWSAGCSSGEEPYSIAMVLREQIKDIDDWDVKILATDLDSNVLQKARAAIYPVGSIENIPLDRRRRWMSRGREHNEGFVRIKPCITELVYFRQLNITGPWPMHGKFDFIFFRNVAIYFKRETQTTILNRLADHMDRDATLFVGHSESLIGVSDRYRNIGRTMHRRK